MRKKITSLLTVIVMLAGVVCSNPASTYASSGYTVEFTYDDLQYVLQGDSRVELSEILDTVGIEVNDDITEVIGSNEELFIPVFDEKEKAWYIEAIKAFNTEEWLKVTIGGVEYEIVVTDDQTVSTWADLKNALAGTDGTVILGADITAGSGDTTLIVTGTKTLDFNGYVISAGSNQMRLFEVNSNSKLTLEDSDPSKEHYYSYNKTAPWTYIGDTYNGNDTPVDYDNMSSATLNSGSTVIRLPGGAIIGGHIFNDRGSALWVNGTLVMNSGSIVGNHSDGSGGSVGGTIYLNAGEFTMNDGTICGNSTHNCGGGVDAKYGGKFYFKGGIISDNYAQFSNGSAVQIDNAECVFDMSGGRITRNHAGSIGSIHYLGSAVLCWNGYFTMTGGEISGNTSDYSTDCAVAVNNVGSITNFVGFRISNIVLPACIE